jgi:hypothetical protein
VLGVLARSVGFNCFQFPEKLERGERTKKNDFIPKPTSVPPIYIHKAAIFPNFIVDLYRIICTIAARTHVYALLFSFFIDLSGWLYEKSKIEF